METEAIHKALIKNHGLFTGFDDKTTCCTRINKIVIGCDDNAHYTSRGITNVNIRGESLIECLLSINLSIFKKLIFGPLIPKNHILRMTNFGEIPTRLLISHAPKVIQINENCSSSSRFIKISYWFKSYRII